MTGIKFPVAVVDGQSVLNIARVLGALQYREEAENDQVSHDP